MEHNVEICEKFNTGILKSYVDPQYVNMNYKLNKLNLTLM